MLYCFLIDLIVTFLAGALLAATVEVSQGAVLHLISQQGPAPLLSSRDICLFLQFINLGGLLSIHLGLPFNPSYDNYEPCFDYHELFFNYLINLQNLQ